MYRVTECHSNWRQNRSLKHRRSSSTTSFWRTRDDEAIASTRRRLEEKEWIRGDDHSCGRCTVRKYNILSWHVIVNSYALSRRFRCWILNHVAPDAGVSVGIRQKIYLVLLLLLLSPTPLPAYYCFQRKTATAGPSSRDSYNRRATRDASAVYVYFLLAEHKSRRHTVRSELELYPKCLYRHSVILRFDGAFSAFVNLRVVVKTPYG